MCHLNFRASARVLLSAPSPACYRCAIGSHIRKGGMSRKLLTCIGIGLFPLPHHQISGSAHPGTPIPHLKAEPASRELTLTGTLRIIGVCGCRSRLSLTGTRPRDKGSSPGASVSASGRAREGFPFHAYVWGKREERR